MPGALHGLRVVELAAIGPGPHAAMILADHGADVIRIERPGSEINPADPILRSRTFVRADLKDVGDLRGVQELIDSADVLIEGFRPGVLERLGLDPEACLERNPRLIVARMTGWGQTGPWSARAGHDLNYISATGALSAIGRPDEPPTIPLNLVGDFGGGSMLLLVGVMAALYERSVSGAGQVVDAAMVDGVSLLMQQMWSLRADGDWSDERRANLLDGGAPFYDTYRCADDAYMAVGAMEPQFFSILLDGLDLTPEEAGVQHDRDGWPVMRKLFTDTFARRTQAEWIDVFVGRDACVTPVLSLTDAPSHPHIAARQSIITVDSVPQAAPAPRLSRSQGITPSRGSVLALQTMVAAWGAR